MPYYPEDQSNENLRRLWRNNVCAVCSRQLYINLDLKTNQKYLECPAPYGHEGISREYEPQREDNETDIRRSVELEQNIGHEKTRALTTLPKHGQLTQPEAMHILQLVYPKAPPDEIVRCAILCRDFALHPLMKEVYLIPFGEGEKRTWATVLGINATRKLMAQRGAYSYCDDTPRLMTEEEQKRIFGEVDSENIVAITKLRSKDGLEAQGYGRWPKGKEPYGTDKGNTKANMAFIRSERNAFGRLSPDALPPDVDIIDEAYAEVPTIGKVSTLTGQIIEGDTLELEDRELSKPFDYATQKPVDRDPKTIKTLMDLYKACSEDFTAPDKDGKPQKMQPYQVIAELGVGSESDISDTPEECYRKIKAVRE